MKVPAPIVSPPATTRSWERWNGDVIQLTVSRGCIDAAGIIPALPGVRGLQYPVQLSATTPARPAPDAGRWSDAGVAMVAAFFVAGVFLRLPLLSLAARVGARGIVVQVVIAVAVYMLPVGALIVAGGGPAAVVRRVRLSVPPAQWAAYLPGMAIAAIVVTSLWSRVVAGVTGHDLTQCLALHAAARESFLLGMVVPFLVAPATEEAVFRGVAFTWLRGRMTFPPALAISTLLFCAAHVPGFGVGAAVAVLPVGLLLGTVYEASGSLLPGIAIHLTLNLSGYLTAAHGCT